MTTKLNDFAPLNTWVETKKNGITFVKDKNTGRTYRKVQPISGRLNSSLLAIVTPFIHLLIAILNSVYRALKLISLYHFWPSFDGKSEYSISDNMNKAGVDAFRIVSPIITLPALEVSSLYGIMDPQNGGKLYASIERAQYGKAILAPGLQPLTVDQD